MCISYPETVDNHSEFYKKIPKTRSLCHTVGSKTSIHEMQILIPSLLCYNTPSNTYIYCYLTVLRIYVHIGKSQNLYVNVYFLKIISFLFLYMLFAKRKCIVSLILDKHCPDFVCIYSLPPEKNKIYIHITRYT